MRKLFALFMAAALTAQMLVPAWAEGFPVDPDSAGEPTEEIVYDEPTEATEMFHILKNAENPHFYGFRLHTFRTTDKVVRYGINNQFDFAEHPAVIQRGEKRTINICVAVPDVA